MNASRSIIGIIAFVGIFILAIWLGISVVTDQTATLAQIALLSTLATCIFLGRRIWMIIPLMGSLNLTFMVPGQPSTMLLGQALFVGFCTLLFLMRRLPCRLSFSEIEFWIILLTVCILQAYIRNPVGLNILGDESMGARPYAIFLAGLVTSIILGGYIIPASDLKWLMRTSIIGGLLNSVMLTVGYSVPRLGVWYGAFNSELGGTIAQQGQYGENRATRIAFVRDIGRNLALWIGSHISPIRACFHPLWAPLILLSFTFAAFSGYRNEIAMVGMTYLVSLAYRGGLPAVTFSIFVLIIGIASLAAVNLAAPLPANIQRSLSFLPGSWDQEHIQDTQDSTEWRVEMWKEALGTDIWIKNKILGDGLGISKQEYDYIRSFKQYEIGGRVGTGRLTKQQEYMMATGAYHSGPVSTVRTIGYAGLLIFILAQIRLAVHAHRLIKKAKYTEWFPTTLLIGIPLIWAPFFFIFIFGDFGIAASSFLIGSAMIRLLERNVPTNISTAQIV